MSQSPDFDKLILPTRWEILKPYLINHKRILTYILTIGAPFFIICLFIAGPVAFYPLFIVLIFTIVFVHKKYEKIVLEKLAELIGFMYVGKGSMESVKGELFEYGDEKEIDDLLVGKLGEFPARMFTYYVTTGSGKHRTTETFVVFEIIYPFHLPNIALTVKEGTVLGIQTNNLSVERGKHLELEGDFNNHFNFNVEKGYEVEALSIFTPELMQKLTSIKKDLNFETYENRLNIFDKDFSVSKGDFINIYKRAVFLSDLLVPKFKGSSGYVKAMDEVIARLD